MSQAVRMAGTAAQEQRQARYGRVAEKIKIGAAILLASVCAACGSGSGGGSSGSGSTASGPAPVLYVGLLRSGTPSSDKIAGYTIGSDGTLTTIGSPVVSSGTLAFDGLAITGGTLYTTDLSQQYSIASGSGTLTPDTVNSTVAAMSGVSAVVGTTGKFLYVPHSGTVQMFGVQSDGSLSPTTDSPFCTSTTLPCPAAVPAWVAIDSSGKFFYMLDNSTGTPAITAFSIGTAGELVSPALGSVSLGAGTVGSEIVASTAGALYATDVEGSTYAFSIQSDGTLSALTAHSDVFQPQGIAADPSGKFVFATSKATSGVGSNEIGVFPICTTNPPCSGSVALGDLGTAVAYGSGMNSPNFVVVDPSGKFVYVANTGSGNAGINSLAAYSFNSSTGALSFIGTTTLPAGLPTALVSGMTP
jgi:6-phosphogluconolactonase